MKRMKKKVVAMVTLAMFMMTLLPMAAFAANPISPDTTVVGTKAEAASVVTGTDVDIDFVAKDAAGGELSTADNALYVWFVDNDTQKATRNVTFSGNGTVAAMDGGYAYKLTRAALADKNFKAKFTKDGEYTLKAGVTLDASSNEVVEVTPVEKHDTVKVAAKVYEVEKVTASKAEFENIQANGSEAKTVTVTVTGKNESVPVGTAVTVTNNYVKKGIKVNGSDATTTEIKTTAVGSSKTATATFDVTANNKLADGTFKLAVECNGVKGFAEVVVKPATPDVVAQSISAVKLEGPIAKANTAANTIKNVKFELKDANGNAVVVNNEPVVESATFDSNLNHDSYVKVDKQPTGANLAPANIWLVPAEDDSATMQLKTTATNMPVGDYVIQIGLQNGQWATASFTVAEFDAKNIEKMVIVPQDDNTNIILNATSNVTKTYEVNYVDKNGIQKSVEDVDSENVTVAINPIRNGLVVDTSTVGTLKLSYNDKDVKKEDILGTKISLLAVNAAGDMSASMDFTVVDKTAESNEYKLVFEDETKDLKGETLKNNKVTAKVVKVDNEKKTLDISKLYVEADKDSGVEVESNGDTITIYSDKDATVDVKVIAVAENGNTEELYADTFTYTIGSDVIPADTSVVMTFGSNQMIVNNEVVTIDKAAPFAENNRTFVPFRALGEALGAQVDYVEEDNTVHYVLGNTEIVMTLDSKDYTVNGAKKTMDVAPFAKEGRTYVPVRFVGEALGFNVTALQNGAGQYVGVAFTK